MIDRQTASTRNRKSTNGRILLALLGCMLWMATTLPAAAGASPDPTGVSGLLDVPANLSAWVHDAVPARGSDARRLRRLHTALLERGAPGDRPDFSFRLVALAREVGIQAYFVSVDAPANAATRGPDLAVGIGHYGRIVVFDDQRRSRPDHRRLRLLDDRSAAAILLGETGVARLAAGDVRGALGQFETALELDPDLAWVWSGLGEALRVRGERERAMDAYEKSLELAAVGRSATPR